MADTNSLPEWDDVQRERAELGSLAWTKRSPLVVNAQQRVAEPVAAWLGSVAIDQPAEEARDALQSLGYLGDTGNRTAAADWARAALDPRNLTSMRIFTRDANSKRALVAGFDNELAVLLTSEGDDWGLSYTDTELLPELIARWLPITPAFAFDIADRPITNEELEAAVQRLQPTADTNAANGYTDTLLKQPWLQFMIQVGTSPLLEFVTVDDWGTFAVKREAGKIHLQPFLSAELTMMIIGAILGALDGDADTDADGGLGQKTA